MRPPGRRSGPRQESRPYVEKVTTAYDATTVDRLVDLPAELERRRAGSWRCEPLHDGWRDPWSSTPWPRCSPEASRRALWHLHDAGLLSEVVVRVLAGAA